MLRIRNVCGQRQNVLYALVVVKVVVVVIAIVLVVIVVVVSRCCLQLQVPKMRLTNFSSRHMKTPFKYCSYHMWYVGGKSNNGNRQNKLLCNLLLSLSLSLPALPHNATVTPQNRQNIYKNEFKIDRKMQLREISNNILHNVPRGNKRGGNTVWWGLNWVYI